MAKVSFARVGLSLSPVDEEALKEVSRLDVGEIIVLDIKRNRSGPYHRRAFALMDYLFDCQDAYSTVKLFRWDLTMGAGYIEEMGIDRSGTLRFKPESLSFENMKQEKFEKWWNDFVQVFLDQFGEEMQTKEMQGELDQIARM